MASSKKIPSYNTKVALMQNTLAFMTCILRLTPLCLVIYEPNYFQIFLFPYERRRMYQIRLYCIFGAQIPQSTSALY